MIKELTIKNLFKIIQVSIRRVQKSKSMCLTEIMNLHYFLNLLVVRVKPTVALAFFRITDLRTCSHVCIFSFIICRYRWPPRRSSCIINPSAPSTQHLFCTTENSFCIIIMYKLNLSSLLSRWIARECLTTHVSKQLQRYMEWKTEVPSCSKWKPVTLRASNHYQQCFVALCTYDDPMADCHNKVTLKC